jgi:hypothetical protein
MTMKLTITHRALAIIFTITTAVCTAQNTTKTPTPNRAFTVYDNVYYPGKPDLRPYGLVPINLIYEKDLWGTSHPTQAMESVLPPRAVFDALARQCTAPGPIVLDVENLGLTSKEHLQVLATLADWAHADQPGKPVGYYGTNTLTKVKPENIALAQALVTHLDAMFPPMYTYDTDQAAWAARAQREVDEAHALAPSLPVYFYLQPQYHHTTPLAYQFIDEDYWVFQLKTARPLVDGVVIWTGTRWPWDEKAGWWTATKRFMSTLRSAQLKP